jgi:hypothetical protein
MNKACHSLASHHPDVSSLAIVHSVTGMVGNSNESVLSKSVIYGSILAHCDDRSLTISVSDAMERDVPPGDRKSTAFKVVQR